MSNITKLIIFDWDDVFTQGATEACVKCYRAAIADVGVKLEPEEELRRIKAKWGASYVEEVQELLKEHPELAPKAAKQYEKHLFDGTFVNNLSLIDGSVELLKQLSKNYKLAIASGVNPSILKEQIFPKFNIPDVFTKIMTVYDVDDPKLAKPHPHINLEIMRAIGCRPEETVMVGDAAGDVQMARSAGVEPIVVLTGHLDRPSAEALGVKHIIEDVTKLPEVLV